MRLCVANLYDSLLHRKTYIRKNGNCGDGRGVGALVAAAAEDNGLFWHLDSRRKHIHLLIKIYLNGFLPLETFQFLK